MLQYLLVGLVFVLISLATFGGYLFLRRRRQRVEQRLKMNTPSDPSLGSRPELLLGDMTTVLASQVPIAESDRSELQRELRVAGYYKPTALMEYAALRAVLIFLPLLVGGVAGLLFAETPRQLLWTWGTALLCAGLGFSLPRIYVYYRGKARMHAIERGLPVAIDMISLCLGAGLNVLNSLHRVAEELKESYPTLAFEMAIMCRQAELRTLDFALAQFADRVGLNQVKNLSVILTQSENLGTDAVSNLREYSDNLRVNMRQRADEMANKAPFKLLFPAYLMALGAAILLISPAILDFRDFQNSNMISNILRQGQDQTPGATPNNVTNTLNQRTTP
jgi:tight adherence protein C